MIQALMDLSPFPITVSRVEDGRFKLVNRRWCKITGHRLEEVIGRTPQELNIYANQADRERMLSLLRQNGRLDKFETRFKTKDHQFIPSQMSSRIITYEGQECLLSLSTYTSGLTKAHQALRESESRFRNILNSISEYYYEVDLNGRYTFVNDAVSSLFGCPTEELIGLSYKSYTKPEDAKRIYEAFNEVYRGVAPIKFVEYTLNRKDGASRQVEVSASLLRDGDGRPIGFHGISRDRTLQKMVEEDLRRSEEKYRRILEEMEEGYYEIDLKGNFTYFNDAIVKIHGYPPDELMGMNYRQYLDPQRSQKIFQIFNAIYKTGNSAQIPDYAIIRKDGSVCISELSAYPLKGEHGDIIGFWGITRDRTEQKKAESALQKSEEQYRLLVDNANDGIYITQYGRIKYYNPKTLEITGYSDAELMESLFVDMVHPEDKEAVYEVQQKKLAAGQIPEVFAFRLMTKQQKALWVELSAIGISWENQPATLNFLRDVTHQKITERRLLQAQKMEAIGTLAGGIAHDFNNILSAILGYAELSLEFAGQGSMQQDNLNEVVKAGYRAKDLVHQILAFARQSDEKVRPVIVSIIAKEALKLIRSSIPTTIEIRQNIASNSRIMGNPIQVHQIMMNLCTNAAHAMEKTGGMLSVELVEIQIDNGRSDAHLNLPGGTYLKLSVSDTGCGITPEIMNTIFDPYFTTKAPGEGTGMGLSVVQGIVEKYGGKITVDSEPGEGSTFTVYLPVTGSETATLSPVSENPPACDERILFVDDEAVIVKMSGRILEKLGYRVTRQTSSIEALRLFRAHPNDFDLVITDMTMPLLTGEQLARQMMLIRPDIPVLLCTGYSKQINTQMVLAMGIKALIYKPIKPSDLALAIRRVLDKKGRPRPN